MRRLLLLLSAVVAVDTMFYTALAPLLPHFAERYGLGKGGAGVLAAAYAAGVLAASVPGGMAASRFGPKCDARRHGADCRGEPRLRPRDRYVDAGSRPPRPGSRQRVLVGGSARLARLGSAGRAQGNADRDGDRGQPCRAPLLGPVLGAAATVAGIRATFLAVGGIGFGLCAFLATTPGAPPRPQRLSALRSLDLRLLGALWLVVLPALLFGVLTVLVPLKLHALGWGGVGLGLLFLATAAIETALNPLLGRFTDTRGRLVPVRLALLGSIAVSLALAWAGPALLVAALVLAAGIAYGAFYTPGMALVSDTAERNGIAQGLAFGVMNLGWALGAVAGPAAGGALAQSAGDTLPYVMLAAICGVTLVYSQPRFRPSKA